MGFPPEFVWGAATSAFQIEGGRIDGKGQSIWDTFSDQGRLTDRADVACDHYHRWPEDVALMKALGLDAYRMSIAWTRVMPEGTGAVNQKGLDFYKRLIDGVLEAGITPWVTLHHWDLPQALQDRGGWADRSTVDAFVAYAEVVATALGDRVSHWITQNEPWVAAVLGYIDGVFAPGVSDWRSGLMAGHHILLSHGQAIPAIRALSKDSRVGHRPRLPAKRSGQPQPRGRGGIDPRRRLSQSMVLRPCFRSGLSRGHGLEISRHGTNRPARLGPSGRPRGDFYTHRLPRGQLLHERGHQGR